MYLSVNIYWKLKFCSVTIIRSSYNMISYKSVKVSSLDSGFHCTLLWLNHLHVCYFYIFKLALTHTSYKVNYGTNPDHARNSLSNCGRRQLEYGDSRIHYTHTRKRGMLWFVKCLLWMFNFYWFIRDIPEKIVCVFLEGKKEGSQFKFDSCLIFLLVWSVNWWVT